jgi:hypothetical protein
MPLYTRTLTVDSQTAEEDAAAVDTEVDEQIITEAEVFIDPGSNGEVRAELLDGDRRIIPEPEGDPIAKPGTTGPVPLSHFLPGVPSTVTLKVWAPDADFSHEVIASWETRDPDQTESIQRLIDLFSQDRVTPTAQGRVE